MHSSLPDRSNYQSNRLHPLQLRGLLQSAQGWLHLCILTLVVLVTYWGMWNAYFATLDDFGITGWVRSRANLWVALQGYGSGVRFLNYAPIWFKSQWFGLNATPYLLSGLAQYLVVVWLVYLFARQLLPRAGWGLLAALFFAVSYTHYEVVTYVSASDYTWWAIFYLGAVVLFFRYLQRGSPAELSGKVGGAWCYWSAVALYGVLAFGHDFTLNLPLVLLAGHLIMGTGNSAITSGDLTVLPQATWSERRQWLWQLVQVHLPFWLLWAIHVTLQFVLVMGGTSEAVYSVNGYAPGLHMVTNLRYLIFLWLPNIMLGPIQSFLATYLSSDQLALLWLLLMGLGTLLHLVLIWAFWRGSTAVRFGIALLYLPFLQYTPWQGHFIEAPRYLLLPSVGAALLMATAIAAISGVLRNQEPATAQFDWRRGLLWSSVTLFVIANIVVVQVWIGQHVENGHFRRGVVTAIHEQYDGVWGPDAYVWIEVPEEKYTDLADACRLIFDRYYVPCETYVAGAPMPSPLTEIPDDRQFFWIKATATGLETLPTTPK